MQLTRRFRLLLMALTLITGLLGLVAVANASVTVDEVAHAAVAVPADTISQPVDTTTARAPLAGGPQYCSQDTPVDIPDNDPAGVTSTISITDSVTLQDVNIYLNTTHTWVGDLSYTVTHAATGVTIVDRPGVPATTFGCSGDDIDATLDDEATAPVEDECAPSAPTINGSFTPNNPLSAFDGMDLAGDWILTVSDNAASDTGILNGWCVVPNTAVPVPSIAVNKTVGLDSATCAATDEIVVPGGTDVYYCYEVTNTGTVTLTLHDLDDSVLGSIFAGFPFTLTPGASVDTVAAGLTISATITTDTVNLATWTAYNPGPSDAVAATDVATVTVTQPPTAVDLAALGTGRSTPLPLAWLGAGLLALAGGFVLLRRTRDA